MAACCTMGSPWKGPDQWKTIPKPPEPQEVAFQGPGDRTLKFQVIGGSADQNANHHTK